jgi:hypothetical protein
VLQQAALERSADLEAQLQVARHQLAVEEAVTSVQPGNHYYVWDTPEIAQDAYYCMPSGTPEAHMSMYAFGAPWEQPVGSWPEQPSFHEAPVSPMSHRELLLTPQAGPWTDGRTQGHQSRWSPSWYKEESPEDYDLCWSFHNKGFCKKGANCTWRHEGLEHTSKEAPLSDEEKQDLQVMVEKLEGDQLEQIFDFLAPELDLTDDEEEVSLDPDMLSPTRQRALFKLVERALEEA